MTDELKHIYYFNFIRRRFSNLARPRDNESLKAKYKTLRLHKKPTGDPDCPPDVRRAKRLYREIEQQADTVGTEPSRGDHSFNTF